MQHPPMPMMLGDVLWKTVVFYFLLLVLLRVTGKREIGTLSSMDLVSFIMISEAALISIADGSIPLLVGMAPVVALAVLELVVSYLSVKDPRVRRMVVGKPSVLVDHGVINERALASLRYSVNDLLGELRAKNLANVGDVEFAVLETSGKLSVVPKPTARPVTAADLQSLQMTDPQKVAALSPSSLPTPVVVDGVVDKNALSKVGKDRAWLGEALRGQGVDDLADVLLASLDPAGSLTVQKRGGSGSAHGDDNGAGGDGGA